MLLSVVIQKKIDASDFDKLRAMKNEAKDVEANEEPPFEPDVKKSTPWKNPQSKAKNMAREMMKKMKAKQDIKEEEQTDKTGKNKKASHDWASDPRVAKAIKYQINQSGKQREKELKEEEQIDEVLDSKMSKLGYMVKSIGSIVKNRGNLDVDRTDKDARRTLTKRKEGYNLVQKKLGPNPIAKRMPTMNALEENTSLESIQEEIRNNLLERANHLLENGNQEQIVEFMNDLTMEQRSILNLQELALDEAAGGNNMDILKYANQSTTSTSPLKLPTDPGSFKLNIPTPQAVQPGPPPPAPRIGRPARATAMDSIVPPGLNSNNDDMSLGNGIVKSIGDKWTSMHTANRDRVDKENDNQSRGSVTGQNRAAELGAVAITGAPAPAPAAKPAAAPVAVPPAATPAPAAAAKPAGSAVPLPTARPAIASATSQAGDETGGFGYDTPIDRSKPAAQQAAAPRQAAPAPVRAAPAQAAKDDTWDNSKLTKTGENGEETAQDFNRNQATYAARAASPRGQAERNMDESKTKYIPESITFERFLRNR